jgi:uncharacterized protein
VKDKKCGTGLQGDERHGRPDVGAPAHRIEERNGMIAEWDVPIEMNDGIVLRADVFRPIATDRYPVIMSYGPYAKGLAFQEGYPSAWEQMVRQFPEVMHGSSGKYQSWEVVDPERWVPDQYVCVRVDGRGAGRSPGRLEPWSPRETRDFYECIEWAAMQPWSNGKVGLNGISYYAMNQWHAASLRPPHLAALCIWEGAADFYRDVSHHGGIYCTFPRNLGSTWPRPSWPEERRHRGARLRPRHPLRRRTRKAALRPWPGGGHPHDLERVL